MFSKIYIKIKPLLSHHPQLFIPQRVSPLHNSTFHLSPHDSPFPLLHANRLHKAHPRRAKTVITIKSFKLKWYIGKIAIGTPYFFPRKWIDLTEKEIQINKKQLLK